MADIPDVDLSKVGTTKFGSFEVEVVDYTAEYFDTLKVGAACACRAYARCPAATGTAVTQQALLTVLRTLAACMPWLAVPRSDQCVAA